MTEANEVWKPIAAYEGRYEVSSVGRVRSLYIRGEIRRRTPLILAPIPEEREYLRVSLRLRGAVKFPMIHALVAEAFLGPKPCPQAEVRHKDHVKTNNRPNNLEYVTRQHPKKNSPEYRSWRAMMQRCTCPNHEAYARYGGKGISVHPGWRASFKQFFHDVGPRPPGCTLDRINNDGDYEPGNVRWSTPKEQAQNTKKNTLITIDGRTQCVQAWADEAGLNKNCLLGRIKAGRHGQGLLAPVSPRHQHLRSRKTTE